MALPPWLTGNKSRIVLKIAGILGSLGAGCYCAFRLMWNFENLRMGIVYAYLTLFCAILLSAELTLLDMHRHFKQFGRFLTTFTGRALVYIFIGGLMLEGVPGYVVGIYLITLGIVNLLAQCLCTGDSDEKQGGNPAAI